MRIPLPESLRPPEGVDIKNPAIPRDAATIVLLRDGANGLETYLLRRRSTLEFAPGDPGEGNPIAASVEHLLLEGCRLLDESRRDEA